MGSETSGAVTMEDLTSAADEAKAGLDVSSSGDGNVVPEGETESKPSELSEVEKRIAAEQELHAVKSNLGRKLAAIEQKLEEVTAKTEAIPQSASEEDEFEIPTTHEEFKAAFEKAKLEDSLKASKAQEKYEKEYLQAVEGVEVKDPIFHQEVYEEMMKNFNVKSSDNATLDAQLNYAKAEAAVLKSKMNTKVNPLEKNVNTNYQNQAAPQQMVNKQKVKEYSLSAEEKEFAQMVGMNEEQIQKAMSTPLTMGQNG